MTKDEKKLLRRENRRKKYKKIDLIDMFGVKDYTPYNAINGTMIINKMIYEKR